MNPKKVAAEPPQSQRDRQGDVMSDLRLALQRNGMVSERFTAVLEDVLRRRGRTPHSARKMREFAGFLQDGMIRNPDYSTTYLDELIDEVTGDSPECEWIWLDYLCPTTTPTESEGFPLLPEPSGSLRARAC